MIETLQDGFISDASQEIQVSHNSSSSISIAMDSPFPRTRVLKYIDKDETYGAPDQFDAEVAANTRPQSAGLLDEILNDDNMLGNEYNNGTPMENNVETSQVPFDSLEQYSPSNNHDNIGQQRKPNKFLLSSRTGSRITDSKNGSSYGKKLGSILEDNVVESEKGINIYCYNREYW